MRINKRIRSKIEKKVKSILLTKNAVIPITGKAKKRDTKAAAKEEDKKNMKDVILKNGVAIDHMVPSAQSYEIAVNKGETMNCNLMYADCGHNNNKFYIMQGLKSGNKYYLWTRWGRVGADGQNAKIPCSDITHLHSEYSKKKKAKTAKGYTEIEIDFEEKKIDKKNKKQPNGQKHEAKSSSKLPDSVKNLLELIFDMKQIEQSVAKAGFNVKKMPLGRLSTSTIKNGYATLKKIEAVLNKKNNSRELETLSSTFYKYIPHDFGFQNMKNFIIRDHQTLKVRLI
jgi:poly [ADP-ribose] polymerase 2/3/4